MTKVLSLRVADDLAEWADEYAKTRGVTRQALLEEGLRSFKDDCERGVPEIRPRVEPPKGVGTCPKREGGGGHVWKSPREDPLRSCVFCGVHGREPASNFDGKGDKPSQGGGEFRASTAGRAAFFGPVKATMESGTGKPEKVEHTPEQDALVERIIADKKRRDAEAVANGTARPGQIAGARRGKAA